MANQKSLNRSRIFNILLYPDNEQHMLAIGNLRMNFDCVGIKHNLDCYEEDSENHKAGELKKEHYHFVVKFKNTRTKSAVSKELEIEERFIDYTRSFKSSAQYLLHYGDDDKHQYNPDELVGKLKADVIKLITVDDKPSVEVMAMNVYEFINKSYKYLTTTELYLWCCENGYINFYIRAYKPINDILWEHNSKYVDKGGIVSRIESLRE